MNAKQADPEVVEASEWRDVPVWSHDGVICTGETYKSVVKLTFAKGAALEDPSGLFNASLDGNARRAVEINEDATIDEEAFKTLIRAAIALNVTAAASGSNARKPEPLSKKLNYLLTPAVPQEGMNDFCPPAVTPNLAESDQATYLAGLIALRDGRFEAAIPLLDAAVRQQPTHPGRRRNLLWALLSAEQFVPTLREADAGLRLTPDDPDLHFAAGSALSALGHSARARAAFAQALTLRPDHAPSWLNMGNACADLDDIGSAETFCRKAIGLDPALPEGHASLGYILTRQGRLIEAVEAYDAAIRLTPAFAQAYLNRAITLLLGGDLRRGFMEYEWRKQHPKFRRDFPPLPGAAWDGSDPAGRTILIRAEQGAGDTIQFARYLPLIRDAGGVPILACAPAVLPLIRSIEGVQAFAPTEALPRYDAWIDQASLPWRLGTGLDTIPCPDQYLRADPAAVQAWRTRLPSGRKIGIVFAGNRRHTGDRRRSVPPEIVAPLLATPDVTFVNLQHGPDAGCIGLPDLTGQLTDYGQTAALIENLDLVITVDTSVAHLSGALGKPTWVLLPFAPDWRWMLGRSDSPWYHSMKLYRQRTAGDWQGIVAEVAHDLKNVR